MSTQAFILPIGKTEEYFSSRRHIEAISITSASYRLAAPGLGGRPESFKVLFLLGCWWKWEGERGWLAFPK